MKYTILLLILTSILSACRGPATASAPQPSPTTDVLPPAIPVSPVVSPASTELSAILSPTAPADDFFTIMGIAPPAPVCTSPTRPQMEGPYYKAGSPERNSLLEEGMDGTRLILVGYVLDQNCSPLPRAWLDFWQADSGGAYDNSGHRLRGHQYTDSQGRYYLETILPGLYASRPIEHIHVKVQPEGGAVLTSQLYFPSQPVEGLTVTLEDRGDLVIGTFNFVLQR